MSRHRDEHLDLCAAHVVGALDEAGRAELEAHLTSGCEICLAELRALSGGVTVLALSLPHRPAPPEARERVLAAVRTEAAGTDRWGGTWSVPPERPAPAPQEPPARAGEELPPSATVVKPAPPRPRALVWAWAAAAALLAVSSVFAWRRAGELSDLLEQARARNDALRETLERERGWAALLESPDTKVVRLAATPEGDPALAARVLFDPASRRAILVAEAFAPGAERDFELWAITATGPASLGLVRADAGGRAVVRLEDVGDPTTLAGFAVSLEPAGGSPNPRKPSGPVVMFGPIGG